MKFFLPSLPARFLTTAAALIGLPVAGADAASFTTIHTFDAFNEGNTPLSVLVQGTDGLLYGTASVSGPYGNGSLYRLRTDGGSFAVLNTLPGINAGSQPRGGLVQARDGNFYGTTFRGGAASEGTLFRWNPTGGLVYLASFTDGVAPGANPAGTLVEGRDGLLYGTAQYGGVNNFGTIYRFAPPSGQPASVATFAGDVGGSYPQADLYLSNDGNFYGTTTQGGRFANGLFFRLAANGVSTVLYDFSGGIDGGMPLKGVVQGSDGALYGATQSGGAYGAGTVYRIVPGSNGGTLSVVHSFSPAAGEGANPVGVLVPASDGRLYGTTTAGGLYNNGCVYMVTPGGGYATVCSFTNTSDGGNPIGGLIQAGDGRLYGTTAPVNGAPGTVFRLDLDLPPPAPVPQAILTSTAAAGGTVLIQGRHFLGATAVLFTAASDATVPTTKFTVLSDTVLSVTVPSGAITGPVRVTANGQTVATPDSLTVSFSHPAFFVGEVPLSDGVYYLQFPDGNVFGYYKYLSDPNYLYHFDLGFEYVIDANDGASGVYFYDFASDSFSYTSPRFPFPYLYDFRLKAFLYYFPDTNNPGRYTSNPRYFYNFGTNAIITK